MTNEEAIEYVSRFCVGCSINMANKDSDEECFDCRHRQFAEIAEHAIKMQIPLKPILSDEQPIRYVKTYMCPVCKKGITGTNIAKWCYHCGQKLDWEGYDETE